MSDGQIGGRKRLNGAGRGGGAGEEEGEDGVRRERLGGKSELATFSKITLKSLLKIINYN